MGLCPEMTVVTEKKQWRSYLFVGHFGRGAWVVPMSMKCTNHFGQARRHLRVPHLISRTRVTLS